MAVGDECVGKKVGWIVVVEGAYGGRRKAQKGEGFCANCVGVHVLKVPGCCSTGAEKMVKKKLAGWGYVVCAVLDTVVFRSSGSPVCHANVC